MYESADVSKAKIDAKGIETIRRDNCPVVAKIFQKVLSLLFETKSLTQVKCLQIENEGYQRV